MAKKKHRKRRGHFCWSCLSYLPNEKFSGRGHRNHLCKRCSKLGKEELEYRSAVRNIDRCLDGFGFLRRHHRKSFERFRDHPNERVRRYIEELEAHWAEERRLFRELCEQDEAWEEEMLARAEAEGELQGLAEDEKDTRELVFDDEDEIPF